MREIRLSGSEGGETAIKAVFPTPIRKQISKLGCGCKWGPRKLGGRASRPRGRRGRNEKPAADRKNRGYGRLGLMISNRGKYVL